MNKSDDIKDIASALHLAQAEMSGAKKKAANPFFKSKYADLNSVVDAVRIPFSNHGLSYSQLPISEDGRVGVETILMHTSGQWISSVLLLPLGKQDAQAAGSAITYARRYSLQAMAGIPAEDDDGNLATHTQQQYQQQQQAKATRYTPQELDMVRPTCDAIIGMIAEGDSSGVSEAWGELNEVEQGIAWTAKTKGGFFTQTEKDFIRASRGKA